jgi:hypothetical protein
MKLSILIISICAITLGACAPKAQLPVWINQQDHDPRYYSAMAVVSTKIPDYKMIARDYAARDIAMQISTTISSEINLHESEIMGISRQDYVSEIRSTTNAKVKNLSPQYSFKDGSKYYVLYRLSKAEYQSQRIREKDLALFRAHEYLEGFDSDRHEPAVRIRFLISALDELAEYLDMDLSHSDRDLHNELFRRLENLPVWLRYSWDTPLMSVIAKDPRPVPLSGTAALAIDSEIVPAAHIPFEIRCAKLALDEKLFSDEQGKLSHNIPRIDSLDPEQLIEMGFDQEHYLGFFTSSTAKAIWQNLKFPSAYLRLDVSRPKIFLDYAYVSGYQSGHKDQVVGYLANLNLENTTQIENAQYLLKIRIHARDGDYIRHLDYYSSFADVHMELVDPQSGATINFVEALSIKSGAKDRKQAILNAEQEAVKTIGDFLLYRLLYDRLLR